MRRGIVAAFSAETDAAPRPGWTDPRYVERVRKYEPLTRVATDALLTTLAIEPGERLLDIGCGLGTTTRYVARRVGPRGAVTGVDISPLLIERAQAATPESELPQVSFQVADAQSASFVAAPFTAAMSQFGVMFFADPLTAFTNIRRQLTGDGRLCFACWQPAGSNPWSIGSTIPHLLPPPSQAGPDGDQARGAFSLSDEAGIRQLLAAAGFRRAKVTAHQTVADVPEDAVVDEDELALMGVPPERMHEALDAVARALDRYRLSNGQLRLPVAFFVVSARV